MVCDICADTGIDYIGRPCRIHGVTSEQLKSRFACAAPGCNHGASTGHVLTWVSREPRVGYCDEHKGQHEFDEDVNDASMCMCGVPVLYHDRVWRS